MLRHRALFPYQITRSQDREVTRYTSAVPPSVIANPILNAPFSEPERHFQFDDEAHHCYRPKPVAEPEKLTGDDRVEAKERDEEARVWNW